MSDEYEEWGDDQWGICMGMKIGVVSGGLKIRDMSMEMGVMDDSGYQRYWSRSWVRRGDMTK